MNQHTATTYEPGYHNQVWTNILYCNHVWTRILQQILNKLITTTSKPTYCNHVWTIILEPRLNQHVAPASEPTYYNQVWTNILLPRLIQHIASTSDPTYCIHVWSNILYWNKVWIKPSEKMLLNEIKFTMSSTFYYKQNIFTKCDSSKLKQPATKIFHIISAKSQFVKYVQYIFNKLLIYFMYRSATLCTLQIHLDC